MENNLFLNSSPVRYGSIVFPDLKTAAAVAGVTTDRMVKYITRSTLVNGDLYLSDSLPDMGYTYTIKNNANGMTYVGSTVSVRDRIRCHATELSRGSHVNSKLQHDFDLYGESVFVYSYTYHKTRKDAYDEEQVLLATTDPDTLYNSSCDVNATGRRFVNTPHAQHNNRIAQPRSKPATNDPGVFIILHTPTNKMACFMGSRLNSKITNTLNNFYRGRSEFTNLFDVTGPIRKSDIRCFVKVSTKPELMAMQMAKWYNEYHEKFDLVGKWGGVRKAGIFRRVNNETGEFIVISTNSVIELMKDRDDVRYETLQVSAISEKLQTDLEYWSGVFSSDPLCTTGSGYREGIYAVVNYCDVDTIDIVDSTQIANFVAAKKLLGETIVLFGKNKTLLTDAVEKFWTLRRTGRNFNHTYGVLLDLEDKRKQNITITSEERSAVTKYLYSKGGVLENRELPSRKVHWDGVVYQNARVLSEVAGLSYKTINRHCNDPKKCSRYFL